MDDDDETYPSPSPTSNGRITLALPIQQPHKPNTGGGREDCWSEEATAVLINAWGERYMELSRGNLKQQHWKEVADIVSSRVDCMKTPKTDVQCKNRIDTVKKKYKAEKAKIGSSGGVSNWRFFNKIDQLIGPTTTLKEAPVAVRSSSRTSKKPKMEEWDEEDDNSSDGLPPVSYNKRPRVTKEVARVGFNNNNNHNNTNVRRGSGSGDSMRELTESILKLGEAYEQAEIAKLQQMVEMEKQRMTFAKEMELQRMQFFMKMQVEITKAGNAEENGNGNGGNEINDVFLVNNNNNDDDVVVDDVDDDNNVSDSSN